MSTKRTFDAFYSDRGTEVAEKHQILSRGKVQSESYMVNPEYLRGGSMSRRANQIAKTILEQMGGTRRLQMFLGANNFVALPNGVMFMFPNKQRSKGNKVVVKLMPSDTYRMEFWNVAGGKAKLVKKFDDVYAEDLVEQFESQTGWYLRIASKQARGRVVTRWIAKQGGLPGMGKTFESTKMRWHVYSSGVRVWDLLNAGKRGKGVEGFALYDLDYVRDTQILDALKDWVLGLSKQQSYRMALDEARRITLRIPKGGPGTGLSPKIEMFQEKGVDVAPAGFKPIVIDTPNFRLEAGFKTFAVRDKVDRNNEPTCIPAIQGGKRDIKVFFRWVSDNQTKIKGMTFRDVKDGMRSEGIKYHSYCAMD